jgi:hypothetical protein
MKETSEIRRLEELVCEYSNGKPDGLKIYVFLDVMDFRLVEIYRHFTDTCHRPLLGLPWKG